jgi:hypothetical protein
MGLDGGTIATRSDILRRSSTRLADGDNSRSTRGGCISHYHETVEQGDLAQTKWRLCALSSEPLSTSANGGVVVCRRGNLYNATVFEDFILKESLFKYRTALIESAFSHLVGPRDATRAILSWKADTDTSLFFCPATHLEANGAHRFVVLWRCGHVFSRRAIDATAPPSSSSSHGIRRSDCPTCGRPFDASSPKDVVELYPTDKYRLTVRSAYSEARASNSGEALLKGRSAAEVPSAGSLVPTRVALVNANAAAVAAPPKKRARKVGDGVGTLTLKPMPAPKPRVLAGGWERLASKSKPGQFYYRNHILHITQWEPPMALAGK